jgi:hypothetical protein
MIVYTPVARQAAGGINAINASCQLAVDNTNLAYRNSQMNARMRLVYRAEVSYSESGDFGDHLDWVSGDSLVQILRNHYRADLVSLFVNDDENGTTCGKGYCISDKDRAYTVVNWQCATNLHSFAHEVGHNLGCDHDRDNGNYFCHEDDYSYGWRWTGNSGTEWRTIMAYQPGLRVLHYSNPDVSFDGQPTGVPIGQDAEAHNAQTIRNRALTVEEFRHSGFDVWVSFGYSGSNEAGSYYYPYNTLSKGISAIIQGTAILEVPTLWMKAGSSNETLTIQKPMLLRTCGGPAVIGQ